MSSSGADLPSLAVLSINSNSSLIHRKTMKADPWRLISQKLAANPELLIVVGHDVFRFSCRYAATCNLN